jgi:hypothetical protein
MITPHRMLCISAGALCWPLASLSADSGSPLAIEQAAGEWVKVRAETVRLQTEWNTERALLASTVELTKARAERLEAERDNYRAKTAESLNELTLLTEKRDGADADLAFAEQRLAALTTRLLELRPKLPPRLADALELSFRSLAGNDAGPGDRMQLVMSVLNRCAQFNASVTCGEEVLQLGGEGRAVDVIYWGLSHGYAVDRHSARAWFGSPSNERWTWTEKPEAMEAASTLIAIYRDQQDPELVAIPARLAIRAQP